MDHALDPNTYRLKGFQKYLWSSLFFDVLDDSVRQIFLLKTESRVDRPAHKGCNLVL